MPRDLPLGNGDLLVTFDSRYQLRDIYYPQVGLENHTGGEPCRFGIWADGQFSWTGDDGWERDLRYAHETLPKTARLQPGYPPVASVCLASDFTDTRR